MNTCQQCIELEKLKKKPVGFSFVLLAAIKFTLPEELMHFHITKSKRNAFSICLDRMVC